MKRKDSKFDSEKTSASPRTSESQPKTSRSHTQSASVAALHKTVGNQAVQRFHENSELQAKLTVSQPGDEHEREAQNVADRVMRMSPDDLAVDQEKRGPERTETAGGKSAIEGEAKQQIELLKGAGKPLSPSTRSFFEQRFGHDFGNVRVHTGTRADEATRKINAKAFTMGRDIVFRSREYRPQTTRGKELLAHELTHVLQQRNGRQRAADALRQTAGGGSDTGTGTSLPSIERVNIATGGKTHPDNCCEDCPDSLGIGKDGKALNGMELQFVLSGHRPGIEYDIIRRRWSSIWERRDGSWSMVEHVPGKHDDRRDGDECLTPEEQKFPEDRLFAVDSPGFKARPPRQTGRAFSGFVNSPHPDATEIVLRFNFKEAVLGGEQDASEKLTMPAPWIHWHSTTWLTRNESGQLVLDRSKCEIGLGHTPAIDSAPSP